VPDDIIECLVSNSEDIIDALGSSGELNALFNSIQAGEIVATVQPAAFADDGVVQALAIVLEHAAETIPGLRPGLSPAITQIVGLTIFYIVFYYVFVSVGSLLSILISSSSLTPTGNNCIVGWKPKCSQILCDGQNALCTGTCFFSGCPCDVNPCPAPEEDGLLCPRDCGGVDSTGTCIGVSHDSLLLICKLARMIDKSNRTLTGIRGDVIIFSHGRYRFMPRLTTVGKISATQ